MGEIIGAISICKRSQSTLYIAQGVNLFSVFFLPRFVVVFLSRFRYFGEPLRPDMVRILSPIGPHNPYAQPRAAADLTLTSSAVHVPPRELIFFFAFWLLICGPFLVMLQVL